MSAIADTPTNLNFLSPLKFSFKISKLPNVNFFIQGVTLPTISISPVMSPSPFVKLPMPGDHIDFGELLISFRVDEDMKNYLEIFNWITALGFPKDFNQYKALHDVDRRFNPRSTDGIMSDGILIIMNSNARSNKQVTFYNMFPTTLTDLTFDTRQSDVDYLETTVSFAYERFDITTIS